MRSCCEVDEDCVARDVLADRDLERVPGCLGLRRHHEVTERDELTRFVRHFDTDCRLARNRREDAHVGGCQRICDVGAKAGDAGDLHTLCEFEFEARDRWSDGLSAQFRAHTVRLECTHQDLTALLDLVHVDTERLGGAEKIGGGQDPLTRSGGRHDLGPGRLGVAPLHTRLSDELGLLRRARLGQRCPLGALALGLCGCEIGIVGRVVERGLLDGGGHAPARIVIIVRRTVAVGGGGTGTVDRLVGECAGPPAHQRDELGQRGVGDEHGAGDADGEQHHGGTRPRQRGSQRLADDGAEPTTGTRHEVDLGHDRVRAVDHVQHAEDGKDHDGPADAQTDSVFDAAAAHHCHADADQHHGEGETTETEQPTEDGVDAPTERTGHVQVHGQHEDDARADEADAPEFDLAAAHHLARGGIGVSAGRAPGALAGV